MTLQITEQGLMLLYWFIMVLIWFLMPLIIRTKDLMAFDMNRSNAILNAFCCILILPYIVLLFLIRALDLITFGKMQTTFTKIYIFIAKLVFPK